MSRRGSIPGTLVVGTLAAIVAFTLAGLAVSQLSLTSRMDTVQRRRNLTESVVNLAMEQVLNNLDYGKKGEPGYRGVIRYDADGDTARLTFDPTQARRLKLPVSTNNLGEDAPAAGKDYSVPGDTVHLVGVGICRNSKTTIEVLLHCPPFPYVITSSGTFESGGSLLVGRLNPAKGLTALSADDLLPGHLATNGANSESIDLGSDTIVTGDVQSVGGIHLDDGAEVRGEIRPGNSLVRIPPVDLRSYRPEAARSETIAENSLSNPTFDGYYDHTGELRLQGGVNLEQGILFVDGDLTIEGGIRGRGALIVTGKTTINGGVDLSTDNRVALLSGRDVEIHGSGRNSSFRGLVYTEGDFTATDVSVVGTFVGNKPYESGGSKLKLRDAQVIQEPGAVKVGLPDFTMAWDFVTNRKSAEVLPSAAGGWADAVFKSVASNGTTKFQKLDEQDVFEATATSYVFRMGFTPTGQMKVSVSHPILGRAQAVFNRPGPGQNIPKSAIKAVEKPMIDFLNSRAPTKAGPPPPLKGPAAEIDWADVDALDDLWASGALGQFQAAFPGNKTNSVYNASFDINQFLAPADRIRMLLWKEF